MRTDRLLACILLVSLVTAGIVRADVVEIEGIPFDRMITAKETAFALHGVGLLRYRIVFRAYVGALYLGADTDIDALWEPETPMRIELQYFWPIRGDQFGPAAEPFLKDNLDADTFAEITDRAQALAKLYRDVEPGDRYALTFVPGKGTELALNGEPLGVIEGDDFAAAYFRIWLGERPIDRRFRDQLLSDRSIAKTTLADKLAQN